MERPIAIIDSGVGGLVVLRSLEELLKQEHFIYFADSTNFPYGKKTEQYLQEHLRRICEYLIMQHDVKLIVLGCNTATVSALPTLQQNYSVPFVGISPAIEEACQKTQSKTIVCLATPRTFESDAYQKLLQYAEHKGVHVQSMVCDALLAMIDKGADFDYELRRCLWRISKDADFLVLGCTHYSFIQEDIKKQLPFNIELLDSTQTLVREVQEMLVCKKIEKTSLKSCECQYIVDGDMESFVRVARTFLQKSVFSLEVQLSRSCV